MKISFMHVLVLAGGFGTRLMPLTKYRPKQLLKLVDKTIIEYLLESLKKAGIKRITVAVNSTHEKIFHENLKDYNLDWIVESPKEENEKLGAVGAIWNAKNFVSGERTLIIGADNFAPDIDFKRILKEHERKKNLATLVLYDLPDKNQVNKYGVAVVDGERIVGFQEKPSVEKAKSKLISTAFYLVEPEFFTELENYINEKRQSGEKPDNLGDLWTWMVEKGRKVGYSVLESYWSDIGSFKGYIEAQKVVLNKKNKGFVTAPDSKIGKAKLGPNVVVGSGSMIQDGCTVSDSIIGSGVKIAKNCTISGSIIDDGVIIEKKGLELEDKVIEKGSFIN
jgi:glucose-1-phosphate thymidylyltransferase